VLFELFRESDLAVDVEVAGDDGGSCVGLAAADADV
jgi:hypothetical protein